MEELFISKDSPFFAPTVIPLPISEKELDNMYQLEKEQQLWNAVLIDFFLNQVNGKYLTWIKRSFENLTMKAAIRCMHAGFHADCTDLLVWVIQSMQGWAQSVETHRGSSSGCLARSSLTWKRKPPGSEFYINSACFEIANRFWHEKWKCQSINLTLPDRYPVTVC